MSLASEALRRSHEKQRITGIGLPQPSVMGPPARQSWPAINRRGQDGITSFGTGVHEPWSGYFTKELLLVGELNG